jgi:raffinose/stachyose/melibiose transport system permease protein
VATRSPAATAADAGERVLPRQSRSQRRRRRSDTLTILGFLLPALVVYATFVLWPIANTFYFSTLDWKGVGQPIQIGLGNFVELLGDRAAWAALRHNMVLIVASLAIQLPIGLALALLLLVPLRGITVLRAVYFLPQLMSTVAIGILWAFIYNPTFGAVNRVLELVGLGALRQGWLGEPQFALGAIIVTICWQYIPFYMILYRAGLTSIPIEVNEASLVDGASPWGRFRYVTFPLLTGTTRTAILLSVIGSLKYFDLIWIMTGGGPSNATDVLATYMYDLAFTRSRLGYGSAIAVVLFLLALLITPPIVLARTSRRGVA